MQKYSLKNIAEIIGGKLIGENTDNLTDLLTDSRNADVYTAESNIFFAIKGDNNDGHKFISELYKIGIRAFIINYKIDTDLYPKAGFVITDDSVTALQKIGKHNRNSYDIPVAGITGSNGKTIVKEWLYYLLMNNIKIVRSPQSYNSQIGVPLSLCLLQKDSQAGIFEAGISKRGEMKKLAEIIKPSLGIFTNIGNAHQQNFSSVQEKILEKIKLFIDAKYIVFPADEDSVARIIKNNLNTKIFYDWSYKGNAKINVISTESFSNTTKINLNYADKDYSLSIPYTDKGSIENAITCFCVITAWGYQDNPHIIKRFSSLPGIAMRLEIIEAKDNSSIINDSYNSDINSLRIALDYLNQKKANKKSVLILSDILQNSEDDESLYKTVAEMISNKNIDKLVGVGSAISSYKDLFPENSEFFPSTHALLADLPYKSFDNSCILLKAARSFEFERISKSLQQKSHKTRLETDLNLMKQNLDLFRKITGDSTKIMAVVKAFSYGNGYQETAVFLEHNRIDYLAVAFPDEGVELRKFGLKTPIMVMNPEQDAIPIMIQHKLEPEIYSLSLLKTFADYCDYNNIKSLNVHIKFDTGMHRLGIKNTEINELTDIINNSGKLNVVSVFSHLAGADKSEHDNFTRKQSDLFKKMNKEFTSKTESYPIRHILNSAGIIRFPEYHFDMVRLGIGLYGFEDSLSDELIPVSRFITNISQIHTLKKGETVGYNRNGELKQDSVIATIPVGYADGFDRRLGNGNWEVLINRNKAKTIGDVCMDMCMIDISGIAADEGDEVEIFGTHNSVRLMAEKLGTISYEIITGISERVKRVYLRE
jgi:Alr-MurF fusion protein